jgi:iron complex outermembrane receptor protein
MFLKILSASALFMVLVPGASLCGDAKDESPDTLVQYRMKEIIVTATRIGSPLENLALSVSFIGPKEIDNSLKNSATDLAGILPGVFIMRTGDFGRSDVNIRGLGSRGRRSLVLMDGRPERMALFDCTVTHSFALHDVEKVEVVKGASSTLYGSGAMGGVMNVIPRSVRNSLEIDLRAAGGTYETYLSSGRLAGRKGSLAGTVSADYRESAGHVENSAYRGTDISARGETLIPGSLLLFAWAKYFDGYKEEPLRATDDPSMVSDTWNDYKRGSFDLGLKGEGDAFHYSARYYRNFGEHRFSDGWHSKDATDGIILYGRSEPVKGLEISGGGDYRFQRGRMPDQPDSEWDKWEAGAYLQAEYSCRERLMLTAGARYNHDDVAGEEVSPSFGLVWRPLEGTNFRAVAAHGFRSPQINELYMFPPSNENLEAERMWNYEAGLRQRIPGGLEIDLSVYRMDGENMIELAENLSPPPMMIFTNTGDFVFDGVEVSLDGHWRGGLGANVSWSKLDPGRWTQGRPGTKVDFGLFQHAKRYTVRLSGRYIDDYYAGNDSTDPIPSYTVVDIYGEAIVAGGVSVFAGLNNIGDEEYCIYTDLPGGQAGLYLMPGRALTAGLKYGY